MKKIIFFCLMLISSALFSQNVGVQPIDNSIHVYGFGQAETYFKAPVGIFDTIWKGGIGIVIDTVGQTVEIIGANLLVSDPTKSITAPGGIEFGGASEAAPTEGLIIYDGINKIFQGYAEGDWIDFGGSATTGVTEAPINSKSYVRANGSWVQTSPINFAYKPLLAYKQNDSILYVAQKYNADYDIVYKYWKFSNNSSYTLTTPKLKTNSKEFPDIDITRTGGVSVGQYFEYGPILLGTNAPHAANGWYGDNSQWSGNTHILYADTSSLVEGITWAAPGTMFAVVRDPSVFQGGGGLFIDFAYGRIFSYAHVSNDTLSGLTLINGISYPYSGNAPLAGVVICDILQTSKYLNSSFLIDGLTEMVPGYKYYCDSLITKQTTAVWDMNILDYTVHDTSMIDTCWFKFRHKGFEVESQKLFKKTDVVYDYQGMQMYGHIVSDTSSLVPNDADSLFCGHDSIGWLQQNDYKNRYVTSGEINSGFYSNGFTDVEKAIITADSKGMCFETIIDRSYGLGAEIPNNYDDENVPTFFWLAKLYLRLIHSSGGKTYTAGTIKKWRGSVTYWDNASYGSFAHDYYLNGKKYAIDVKAAGTTYYPDNSLAENTITTISADAGLTVGSLSDTVMITTTGQQSCILSVEPNNINIPIDNSKIIIVDTDTAYLQGNENLKVGTLTNNRNFYLKGNADITGTLDVAGQTTLAGDMLIDNDKIIYLDTNSFIKMNNINLGNAYPIIHWSGGYTSNFFAGYRAGNYNVTGTYNTGFGYAALFSLSTGGSNTAIGSNALSNGSMDTEGDNTAVGARAGSGNSSKVSCTLIGTDNGKVATTGQTSVGADCATNVGGTGVTSVGYSALTGTFTGNYVTAFGAFAGGAVSHGANSLFLGPYTGELETGSNKIMIGCLNLAGDEASQRQAQPIYIEANSTTDSQNLFLNGNIIIDTKTPSSASDTGTAGTICWDADYIYICTATDTWKRVAIATW